jgi:short-subunit dehydrogenase
MHVAITGASSGIGEALARELAGADPAHTLTLVARRADRLAALVAELGAGRARPIAHDLGDPARATAWVAEAEVAFGPIDCLVNNAGMLVIGDSAATDPDACRRVVDLNLTSPMLLVRHLLPGMIARRRGLVVNVTSLAAIAPMPMQTYYGASKAGLAAFSESLRGELAGTGVHVLTVYPGPVTTAMGEAGYVGFGGRDAVPPMPEADPAKLARAIHRAMDAQAPRLIYPRVYGLARVFPGLTRLGIDRFAPKPRA